MKSFNHCAVRAQQSSDTTWNAQVIAYRDADDTEGVCYLGDVFPFKSKAIKDGIEIARNLGISDGAICDWEGDVSIVTGKERDLFRGEE